MLLSYNSMYLRLVDWPGNTAMKLSTIAWKYNAWPRVFPQPCTHFQTLWFSCFLSLTNLDTLGGQVWPKKKNKQWSSGYSVTVWDTLQHDSFFRSMNRGQLFRNGICSFTCKGLVVHWWVEYMSYVNRVMIALGYDNWMKCANPITLKRLQQVGVLLILSLHSSSR